MIVVKVVHRHSGNPVEGKKVVLNTGGFLSGGVSHNDWTDTKGEAHFDVAPSRGKVIVDGFTQYEGYLSERVVVYI